MRTSFNFFARLAHDSLRHVCFVDIVQWYWAIAESMQVVTILEYIGHFSFKIDDTAEIKTCAQWPVDRYRDDSQPGFDIFENRQSFLTGRSTLLTNVMTGIFRMRQTLKSFSV